MFRKIMFQVFKWIRWAVFFTTQPPEISIYRRLSCIMMPSRYHPRGKAAIALLTEVSLYGYRLMEINTSLMRQPVYYGKLVRYKRQKDCIFV